MNRGFHYFQFVFTPPWSAGVCFMSWIVDVLVIFPLALLLWVWSVSDTPDLIVSYWIDSAGGSSVMAYFLDKAFGLE